MDEAVKEQAKRMRIKLTMTRDGKRTPKTKKQLVRNIIQKGGTPPEAWVPVSKEVEWPVCGSIKPLPSTGRMSSQIDVPMCELSLSTHEKGKYFSKEYLIDTGSTLPVIFPKKVIRDVFVLETMETRVLLNDRMVPCEFWTDDMVSRMSYPRIIGIPALNFMKAFLTIDCSGMEGRHDFQNSKIELISNAKQRRQSGGGGDEFDLAKPYPFLDDDVNAVDIFCNISDFVRTDYSEIGNTLFPDKRYLAEAPESVWPSCGKYKVTRPYDDGRSSNRELRERYEPIDGLRSKRLFDRMQRGFSARWFIPLPVKYRERCVWVLFIVDTGSSKTFVNVDVANELNIAIDGTHRILGNATINGIEQGLDDVLVSDTEGREKGQNILSVTRFLGNAKAIMEFDHSLTNMYDMQGRGACNLRTM